MKYSIMIILLFLIYSCNLSSDSDKEWQIWDVETLKHYQLSFDDIIILNSKEALLFGSENTRENEKLMREQQNFYHTGFAVIYKTKDGGKTWQKRNFDKGGFWHTCQSGNTLFASKVVNHGRLAEMTTELYCSTDRGETWEKVNEFLGEAVFLALDEAINGFIGGLKSNSNQRNPEVYRIMYGQMQGQNNKIIYPATWSAESKEIFYFKWHSLCVFENVSTELKEYRLPVGFDGYFAEKRENEYWMIGRKDEQCCIYKMLKGETFKLVYCFPSNGERTFPKGLRVFGDEIVALIGTRNSAYVVNSTYFSSDGGKTWHEERLPKSRYLNPVDFIKTKEGVFGMGYAGSGKIQVNK